MNTYMEVNDVITMINYINEGKKICNGVGMQSHLSTTYPSVDYYLSALKSFLNAGFEVQITELDATNKGDQDLSNYLYSILKQVMQLKKSGKNITCLTIWGLADDVTWIRGEKPLLFSNIYTPKTAYYGVLQAFKDSGYTSSSSSSQGTSSGSSSSSQTNSGTIKDGWYYIKNVHAQKYLQVAGNKGGNGVNVEIGTGSGVRGQKWYVKNLGNGYFTLENGNGYMLDLQYGENKDGANIQTYQANNATAQQFKAVSTGNNTYGIVTRVSSDKRSLDVYNWGTGDGTNVCQWSYMAANNQKWIFEATSK
nr:RICIN domain-containing protein [Eubacterium xylanophilum]